MSTQEEIITQLNEYEGELEGINALLEEDPENEELLGLKSDSLTLISQLKELLTPVHSDPIQKQKSSDTENIKPLSAPEIYDPLAAIASSVSATLSKDALLASKITHETGPHLPQLAFDRGLYVGLPSEAVWEADGEWYPATIENISSLGVRVKYKSYGDVVILHPSKVRQSSSLLENKKRKRMESEEEETGALEEPSTGLPSHLMILETDSEKVKEQKKRQAKIWKQEKRKERTEVAENKAKVSWNNFKNNLKKTGFSSAKKESMFRTNETGGKVGVVGSGKGMTPSQRMGRTSFNTQQRVYSNYN